MKSISNTKQSNLLWHFLKTVNWLSLKRLLLPWASKKCLPIAEFLCSAMRWWRCRAVYPTKCFWTKQKETRVRFNPKLSANRPSNNWAQVYRYRWRTPQCSYITHFYHSHGFCLCIHLYLKTRGKLKLRSLFCVLYAKRQNFEISFLSFSFHATFQMNVMTDTNMAVL